MKKQQVCIAVIGLILASLALMSCSGGGGAGGGGSEPSTAKAFTAFSFTSPSATGTIQRDCKDHIGHGTDWNECYCFDRDIYHNGHERKGRSRRTSERNNAE